jgi:hypothetical protein
MKDLLTRVPTTKIIEKSIGSDQENTAVGIRRVGRIDRINFLPPAAFEVAGMYFPVFSSPYSRTSKTRGTAYGSRPSTIASLRGDELNRVASFDIKDIAPTNNRFTHGVCNDDMISVQLNFGPEKNSMAQAAYCRGYEYPNYFPTITFISNCIISKTKRPCKAYSTQEPGIFRSENHFLHTVILSQEQLLQDGFAS